MSLTRDPDATELELDTSLQHSRDNSLYATPMPSFSEHPQTPPSQIYTATYSGVNVLESVIHGIAVMRRRHDSSFNATQLLKVAGVDKAKRTKILEKEVHVGTHEKVQGGYGKFQGTWIPYDRAVALAQQYGVYEQLKPLFLFNVADDTPTKEQATAKRRLEEPAVAATATATNGFYRTMSRQPSALGRAYSTLTETDEPEVSSPKKPKVESKLEVFEHDLEIDNPNAPFTLAPLSGPITEHEHSKEIITQIFLSQDADTLADAVGESALVDVNLDVAIDELGHTALHWASALARIPLATELVRRGSVRTRGNNHGESPLIRAVLVTNNYDQGSFGELLDLLYPCVPLLDHQHRSVLHHIALTAGIKRRSAASRYYLETLLEWLVKTGGPQAKGSVTLGRFMSETVNAQDKNGDTCLNIAARIGNRAIVQQLLDVGADPSIPNRAGLRPVDFGINVNGLSVKPLSHSSTAVAPQQQSSQKILDSMQQVLNRLDADFQSEISAKQSGIDELHFKLRTATTRLSESRRNLETLKESERILGELKQKIANIDKATAEEETRFLEQTTELGSIGNYDVDFDADEPFRVLPVYDAVMAQIPEKSLDEIQIDPRQINRDQLPPAQVLRARITAYRENEKALKQTIEALNSGSQQLEQKFRRVVALCTGVPEDKVDGILDGLVQAVESDPDEVDMGRVVGFLRKVDV